MNQKIIRIPYGKSQKTIVLSIKVLEVLDALPHYPAKLSNEDVMAEFTVSRATIYRWCKRYDIPFTKVKNQRLYHIEDFYKVPEIKAFGISLGRSPIEWREELRR